MKKSKLLNYYLLNQKIGNWTIKSVGQYKGYHLYFLCECICGIIKWVRYQHLKSGSSTGCSKEVNVTHGMSYKAEYRSWRGMKNRCYKKNVSEYENYGGRGIAVCDRWLESFENFYEDMGNKPTSKHTLDRIDNNGNYCPENCRWANYTEQANNNRHNRIVTIDGKSKLVADWAREMKVNFAMIHSRLKRGWNEYDAVMVPIYGKRKSI